MLSLTLPYPITVLRLTKVGCGHGHDHQHMGADNTEGLTTAWWFSACASGTWAKVRTSQSLERQLEPRQGVKRKILSSADPGGTKKPQCGTEGREPAGWFVSIPSLIQFPCRDALLGRTLPQHRVWKGCLLLHICSWLQHPERGDPSQQSSNNSEAVRAVLQIPLWMRWCYLGDSPAHRGYASLPSRLCCFFASLYLFVLSLQRTFSKHCNSDSPLSTRVSG